MATPSPADIARDTLKLLAARRLAPTPTHYQAVYEEVAGLLPQVSFPQAPLRRIATVLPTQTPSQKRIAQHFAAAVEAQDWTALQSAIADYAQLDLGITPKLAAVDMPVALQTLTEVSTSLAQQLNRLIETFAATLGEEDQRMHALTKQFLAFLQSDDVLLSKLEHWLNNYSYRLSFTAEDYAQRRQCVHDMLRMAGEHIAAVAAHDPALQQQAHALSTALEAPWTLHQLDAIQTHLKSLLFRHLALDGARTDAHTALKHLLGEHALQMANLGKLSESHASALNDCAQQIQQAQDVGDLTAVLESVVQSGHALAQENRIVQAQLADLREQNLAQEAQIAELSQALHLMEDSTRHDPETGALNLQGFQDALFAEAARTHRQPQPTALAALVIHDLEQLQLNHGEEAAAAAQLHVARLMRATLRPQDALGRTSATQFAVLFPNTEATAAAQALARLQTVVQSRPLLLDEHHLPLSLNVGVIALNGVDTPAEALERANAVCEQAQHMGAGRIALG